jgi:acyl-CoA synthetase (AMP-forming)/AMP-acid ligase II
VYSTTKIFDFARVAPDAPAMIYNLEPISFRAFHRMITGVRRRIAAAGLRPGGVAVVWIDSLRVAWPVDLALRTLGLTTVSVRDAAGIADLRGLDIVALVTASAEGRAEVDPALAPSAVRIVVEPADYEAPDDGGALEAPPAIPPGGHILLTSATTGRSKMIMINPVFESANVTAAEERKRAQGLGENGDDRRGMINLLNLGLWTAAGYSSPIAAWSIGGAVVFHPAAQGWRSLQLPALTNAMGTPALFSRALADAPATLSPNPRMTLVVTGAQPSRALVEKLKALITPNVVSGLGSTEGGGWATTRLDTPEDLRWHRLNPARVVEVVDEDDQPLPPGRLGQVRVKLANGFTGYFNDPETTALFFKDGFFYPGDLGVLDGEGRMALFGRVTDVVNIQGDKVPALPFEEALQDALGLEGVCVFSEAGPHGTEELHVALETAEPIDETRLREAAQAHLIGFPDAHFHFIEALPRNEAGKVQRFRLKQRLLEAARGSDRG